VNVALAQVRAPGPRELGAKMLALGVDGSLMRRALTFELPPWCLIV
jgi:hypothetical protein